MRAPDIRGAAGQSIQLGALLGRGGEGEVWEVKDQTTVVAKVYHKPLSADRADKIRVMAAIHNETLRSLTAWPTQLLSDRAGKPVGLLMPKVVGRKDIHTLYSPKSRRVEFQSADWRFLVRAAANTARAFAAVHESGTVIGDVNHGSILVGTDATVRLIDCDSFQILSGGRRFLCEVGVETFTPPELQGRSFSGVERTRNHDDFGLAVVAFLLLFMGRHPFAGKFGGVGDMPISRAIQEVRFPYGSRHQAVQMERPPGTPPLAIVGREVDFLFERAFAREMTHGGRPEAREWIASLSKLEGELAQCRRSPVHWHHRDVACPWCIMEGSTGVLLFGFAALGAHGVGAFDLDQLWRVIESIRHPGPLPVLPQGLPSPTGEVAILARVRLVRWFVGFGVAFAGLVFAGYEHSAFFGWAGVFTGAGLVAIMGGSQTIKKVESRRSEASKRWMEAKDGWEEGERKFTFKRIELGRLRQEWLDVPTRRLGLLDQLRRDQRKLQLERFLDGFEISRAKIDGIGPGKKQTLESYGIETALDVVRFRVLGVPGFGPKTADKILEWRAGIERRFRFDASRGVDPRDIQRVEGTILAQKKALEDGLRSGVYELRQIRAQILSSRRYTASEIEAIHREYVQAEADYHAIK